MKTKLILILAFIVSFALAVQPVVTITDTARVLLDGEDIGAVPDAVKNGVVTPSQVQAALLARFAAIKEASAKVESDAAAKVENIKNVLREKKAKEEASGKGGKWEAFDELETTLAASVGEIRAAEIDAQIEQLKEQKRNLKKP